MFAALSAYRWLIQIALTLALIGGGYFKGRTDYAAVVSKARLEQSQEARKLERQSATRQQEIIDAKDASLRTVNARLADALERLHDRPARLPEAATAACEGATGRELSGPDAGFLERLAARAEALRQELKAYQDQDLDK